MRKDSAQLIGLVRALSCGPRLPGLTPLNNTRHERFHRTSEIIEALLESLRLELNPPRL